MHNFGLQEYMRHPELAAEVFDVGYWLEDGMLHLDERPGLGVNFNEERAADYPVLPGIPARRPPRRRRRAQLVRGHAGRRSLRNS